MHTIYSSDSVIDFESLVDGCLAKGIDAVAVMDHDVFQGALEFRRLAAERRNEGRWAPRVLPGEEVRTTGGEICGLFLEKRVPDHLPPVETMRLIKDQGGLVYIPHPFDILKLKRLKASELNELSDLIDVMEVFNGKPRFPWANLLAERFMWDHPFPQAAGSDAHEPTHIGAAYVEMPDFQGPGELLEALAEGTVTGKRYNPFASAYIRFRIRRR